VSKTPKPCANKSSATMPRMHARCTPLSMVEQEDALLYHIILNTERLSVDACVHAVCQLAEDPRFQDQATTGSVLADKLLEAKINSALAEHVSVSMAPAGVTVSAANGRITLAGMTSSGGLRARAEQVTQSIAGAHDIDNRIVSVPNRGGGGFLLNTNEDGSVVCLQQICRICCRSRGRRLDNVRDRL